jgi:hypothetical protein
MPSHRRQLNVRLSPDGSDRFDALFERVSKEVGVPLTQAQIIELALKALEREHPADPPPPGAAPKRRGTK